MKFDKRFSRSIYQALSNQTFNKIYACKSIDNYNWESNWYNDRGPDHGMRMEIGKLVNCSCPLQDELCAAYQVGLGLQHVAFREKPFGMLGIPEVDDYAAAILPSPESIGHFNGAWGRVWIPPREQPFSSAIRYCRNSRSSSQDENIIAALAGYAKRRFQLVNLVSSIRTFFVDKEVWHWDDGPRMENVPVVVPRSEAARYWQESRYTKHIFSTRNLEDALKAAMDHFSFSRAGDSFQSCLNRGVYICHEDNVFAHPDADYPVVHAHIEGPFSADFGIGYEIELGLPEYPDMNKGSVFHLQPWLRVFAANANLAGIDVRATSSENLVTLAFGRDQHPFYAPIAIAHICRYAADSASNLLLALNYIKSCVSN